MRTLPIFATILVFAAIAIMMALGFWQLQRAEWKNALLTEYEAAANLPQIRYPAVPQSEGAPYFRRSSVHCLSVVDWRKVSGRSAAGEAGWAYIAQCRTAAAEGSDAQVMTGWSRNLIAPQWDGGVVDGMIAPDSQYVIRLVADKAIDGLERSQPPSLDDIPNNHFSYAIQWFLFAFTALIIFILAMRGQRR